MPADAPLEKVTTTAILKWLNSLANVEAIKIHGHAFMRSGDPDIIGCARGRFFAFEVKRKGAARGLTKLQSYRVGRWRGVGALVEVVTSLDEVQEIMRESGLVEEE